MAYSIRNIQFLINKKSRDTRGVNIGLFSSPMMWSRPQVLPFCCFVAFYMDNSVKLRVCCDDSHLLMVLDKSWLQGNFAWDLEVRVETAAAVHTHCLQSTGSCPGIVQQTGVQSPVPMPTHFWLSWVLDRWVHLLGEWQQPLKVMHSIKVGYLGKRNRFQFDFMDSSELVGLNGRSCVKTGSGIISSLIPLASMISVAVCIQEMPGNLV